MVLSFLLIRHFSMFLATNRNNSLIRGCELFEQYVQYASKGLKSFIPCYRTRDLKKKIMRSKNGKGGGLHTVVHSILSLPLLRCQKIRCKQFRGILKYSLFWSVMIQNKLARLSDFVEGFPLLTSQDVRKVLGRLMKLFVIFR